MTSKKAAGSKRAALPRAADYTKTFLKDWERLTHAGRYDMTRLKEVMLLLIANDAPLGPEWLDHPLQGDWQGHRDCHVGGDFLLAYKMRIAVGPVQSSLSARALTRISSNEMGTPPTAYLAPLSSLLTRLVEAGLYPAEFAKGRMADATLAVPQVAARSLKPLLVMLRRADDRYSQADDRCEVRMRMKLNQSTVRSLASPATAEALSKISPVLLVRNRPD